MELNREKIIETSYDKSGDGRRPDLIIGSTGDELERRLIKTVRNSKNHPPATGINQNPSPKSLRGKSEKPSGGQLGHKGYRPR